MDRVPVQCLEKHTLDGCSHDEMRQLDSLQRANEAVRSVAWAKGQSHLKAKAPSCRKQTVACRPSIKVQHGVNETC
ncbi:uncharacterized protein LOC142777278 isoform X2 [Rhipicephalus microplus]|uniref:uncharacterized protein LOC142777278 isoform X2 n=1 Tax=Rhipicephalus microplus TaxID=6941 RepID=UPI003F6AC033